MRIRVIVFLAVLYCLPACCQDFPGVTNELTDAEKKAEQQRVKAEQKYFDQRNKDLQKQQLEAAKHTPTWAVIDASGSDLKGVLIQHMRPYGYSVDSESDHVISFVKEVKGWDAVVATLMIGNKYSDNPIKHVQFTLTPDSPGKTRVDVAGAVTVRMPFGKINRIDTTNNPAFKRNAMDEFEALKSWAAAQQKRSDTETKASN